jgi:galactonate dehydratase
MNSHYTRRKLLAGAAAGALTGFPFALFGQALEGAVDQANLASSPSELRITELKCGFIRGGGSLFVKIYTNQGIYGCGEGVKTKKRENLGGRV